MTTTSPDDASSIASRIAARRSGSTTKRPAALLGARRDLGDDRERVLAPRVVARDDREVGVRRRRATHERALGPVAIAAGSEHHDQPALRERPGRSQHVLDAVGRVGVVDHHEEPLPHLDRLDAAGDTAHGRDRVGRDAAVDPQRPGGRERGQGVLHVERPAQRRADRHAVGEEGDPLGRRLDLGGAHVGVGREPERDRRQAGGRQASAVFVIEVHDGAIAHRRCEQPRLGEEVLLHRRVVVEMILREVGEHRHRVPDAVDAVLIEPVRGDFHRDGGHALVGHPGDEALQIGRLGRRPRERLGPTVDPDAGSADDPRGPSVRSEDRLEQERGRGLPVRAGHADDRHRVGRPPVERRRDRPHRRADIRHVDLGHVQVQPAVDHDGRRPARDRVAREGMAVGRAPGHAEEQGARPRVVRAVADARDEHVAVASELGSRQVTDEVVERSGVGRGHGS